ncbi:MAG TPA: transposase, partial [Chloroflexota bacterium]|nr:transposase [Chloroflexota bacterium]
MRLPPKPPPADPLATLVKAAAYADVAGTLLPHGDAVPLSVMVRGTLEWLLDEPTLEGLLVQHAPDQYTRELTLHALVRLVIQVAAGIHRSVHAAYQADQALDEPTLTTTFQAVYGKLGRLQPAVSEAVVRRGAERCQRLLTLQPGACVEPWPGYRTRILDGNVLAGTEHRLAPLRRRLNACLPGKSLVVYEPGTRLVTDVVLCEDAYTQERALLTQILPRAQARDLFIADRNFCTTRFVFGLDAAQAFVLVRQHASNLPCVALEPLRPAGNTATGALYEQRVQVTDPDSQTTLTLRRIEVRLHTKTRDGDPTLALLTNVPTTMTAVALAEAYRTRWAIEEHFQLLTQSLRCELPGLGKPRAALFGFALALLAANALAVVRGGIRSAQGAAAEAELSGYYLADELAHDYRALLKYVPPAQWAGWRELSAVTLAPLLRALAARVNVKGLTRSR